MHRPSRITDTHIQPDTLALTHRFQQAASVYAALASRRSGPGESGVSLEERVSALQAAVLQVRIALLPVCSLAV